VTDPTSQRRMELQRESEGEIKRLKKGKSQRKKKTLRSGRGASGRRPGGLPKIEANFL